MVSEAAFRRSQPGIRAELTETVYTVSIGDSIYVIHAFQKKSKSGIATPLSEIALLRERLRQLRNEVKNAEKTNS
jgi:phage-related protein